jgi:hypothetical protein
MSPFVKKEGSERGELEAAHGGAEVAAPPSCHVAARLALLRHRPVQLKAVAGAQAEAAQAGNRVAPSPCPLAARRDATSPPPPLKQAGAGTTKNDATPVCFLFPLSCAYCRLCAIATAVPPT